MPLSIKIQKRRVKRALKPVYENLDQYASALQSLLKVIEQESGQKSDSTEVPGAVVDGLSSLPNPSDFLPGSLRVKKVQPHPLPARRKARHQLLLAAAYLNVLHNRLNADDFLRPVKLASCSALQVHTQYLLDCVGSMQAVVDPKSVRSNSITAGRSMLIHCRHIARRANGFRVLSLANVESFNEKDYLEANDDVVAAIEQGSLRSGIEHFARSGLRECQAGYRDAAGFDVQSVKFASLVRFDTPRVKQSRDVIRACGDFDELWYRLSCPHHLSHTQNALDHYVAVGEGLGCMPNDWFDPSWYRKHYQLPAEVPNAFSHYLAIGRPARLKPNAVMDPIYYGARYGASIGGQTDLVSHYYQFGHLRGWQPAAEFNAQQYSANCMEKGDTTNPITHYRRTISPGDEVFYGDADTITYANLPKQSPTLAMAEAQAAQSGDAYVNTIRENVSIVNRTGIGAVNLGSKMGNTAKQGAKQSLGMAKRQTGRTLGYLSKRTGSSAFGALEAKFGIAQRDSKEVNIASQIKYFANPGPGFETPSRINTSLIPAKAKTIAFFLPQFYAFEKNDEWWGKGFTEWRNVSRGTPRFENHYQPRIPRDLGFYDLTNVDTLKAQAELAKQSGIEAFCFYYYWFNGERLMDKPLDLFVDADIDQDFCIMWANENWTRTWDGFEGQVLIQQDYRDEDEDAFIADTARYFNHPRYISVDGRPLFILYRPGLLPNAANTVARWKRKWEAACGVEPWVLMVQGFGDEDPRAYKLDGAVEFPPHKLCADIPDINSELNILDPNYSGNARDYNAVVETSLNEATPAFPFIKTP